MVPTSEEREQLAIRTRATAGEWRQKGHVRWELTKLSRAVKTLLGVAVERMEDSAGGTRFLNAHQVEPALIRMIELNRQLYEALHRDRKPTAGAVENDIAPVHIAWLMGCWDSARDWLSICLDELVRKFFPLTPFWREYCRAMGCLAAPTPYDANVPRIHGYEKHWVPYLKLVAALTNGRLIATSRQEIAEAFQKRNGDKRLIDWQMIDGDEKHPVRWDFREASILQFAEHLHLSQR